MSIQIQNVLSRQKEELHPIEPGKIRMYVCGVTVYGRCHVGHLRCYLSFDAIIRYLMYRGLEVRYVRNFTDIDDKIIHRAREIAEGPSGAWRNAPAYASFTEAEWAERLAEDEQIRARAEGSPRHLAEFVSDYFIDVFRHEDFGPFNLVPATVEPRVSERIPGVIALIQKIMERGFAYASDGDVYFDVPRYHAETGAYGKLSGRDFREMQKGERVGQGERKRNEVDFALWKRALPGEPSWPSPWGDGRPGWHIECSAMSAEELGQPFDIHGGGKDLIFPHHENEIAQSEASSGLPFCHAWLHNGFVTVDGVKMSKSLGNFITIQAGLRMAPPEVWRFLILSTHYAHPIDFSRTREGASGEGASTVRGTIDVAFDRLEYFYKTLRRAELALFSRELLETTPLLPSVAPGSTLARFVEAMDDDFNTARALAGLGDTLRTINELLDLRPKEQKKLPGGEQSVLATVRALCRELREALGALGLCTTAPETALTELRAFLVESRGLDAAAIESTLAERAKARQDRDFARSDTLRDELLRLGVELRDGPTGTEWWVKH